MNRNLLATLFFLFFVFIIAHQGATMTGKDILILKKAGVSDQSLQLIAKEKVLETAAFSVDDIVNMKKAGVSEKTLRILIKQSSFLRDSEPIVYGSTTQSIRHISPQDVINLKNKGVSDNVIQSIIEGSKSADDKEHERAWRMLENMDLRIYDPVGR
jgi:hypothetical protein